MDEDGGPDGCLNNALGCHWILAGIILLALGISWLIQWLAGWLAGSVWASTG